MLSAARRTATNDSKQASNDRKGGNMTNNISRRHVLGGAIGAAGLTALGARPVFAQVPKPASPLSLNIIDAAGNLALTQPAFENYRKANPQLVSRIAFT